MTPAPGGVVRDDFNGGMSMSFMFWVRRDLKSLRTIGHNLSPHGQRGAKGSEGQASVEYALLVPLLFLLIVNAVNFGAFIYAWVTMGNAARAAADYGVLSSASVGSLTRATSTQIAALVTNDTAVLPATVSVCVNTNSTSSAATGTCSFTISAIPADPEGASYTLLAVDLKYTYTPLIPSFSFPRLGIYSTLPPTTISRRAVMRVVT
jgi:Flp pilus assembly protein TadG